jgi:hypothetical protein
MDIDLKGDSAGSQGRTGLRKSILPNSPNPNTGHFARLGEAADEIGASSARSADAQSRPYSRLDPLLAGPTQAISLRHRNARSKAGMAALKGCSTVGLIRKCRNSRAPMKSARSLQNLPHKIANQSQFLGDSFCTWCSDLPYVPSVTGEKAE